MSKYNAMSRTSFGEDKGGEKSAVEKGLDVVTTVAKAAGVGRLMRAIGKSGPSI